MQRRSKLPPWPRLRHFPDIRSRWRLWSPEGRSLWRPVKKVHYHRGHLQEWSELYSLHFNFNAKNYNFFFKSSVVLNGIPIWSVFARRFLLLYIWWTVSCYKYSFGQISGQIFVGLSKTEGGGFWQDPSKVLQRNNPQKVFETGDNTIKSRLVSSMLILCSMQPCENAKTWYSWALIKNLNWAIVFTRRQKLNILVSIPCKQWTHNLAWIGRSSLEKVLVGISFGVNHLVIGAWFNHLYRRSFVTAVCSQGVSHWLSALRLTLCICFPILALSTFQLPKPIHSNQETD